jgi:hypothetical protein
MVHQNKANVVKDRANYDHEPQNGGKVDRDKTNPVDVWVVELRQNKTVTDRKSG